MHASTADIRYIAGKIRASRGYGTVVRGYNQPDTLINIAYISMDFAYQVSGIIKTNINRSGIARGIPYA
jgi:hypothetical protein